MDTFKIKLNINLKKCENHFLGKKAILLSCGPSIEKYKNLIDFYRNKNTILVVIKTATDYSNYLEDFFFYDPRIYKAHRTEFKYSLNKNSLKVLCHDYKDSEFKSEIHPNIEIYPLSHINTIQKNINDYIIIKNKIYQDGNKYFPIILKAIHFLCFLGIKDIRIFGCDWYNKDLNPQAKHFEKESQKMIGFDNLIGSFYCNYILDKYIKQYNLNILLYSEYSQITTSIPRRNLKNETLYQKSNYYLNCKNKFKINDNYIKILELCKQSIYINDEWYLILIKMVSNIDNYKYLLLDNLNVSHKKDPLIYLSRIIGLNIDILNIN